jgi:hypothetical protein
MFIRVFDRCDRLGSNLLNYIAQLVYARADGLYIRYDTAALKYAADSIFTQALFACMASHNAALAAAGTPDDDTEASFSLKWDLLAIVSSTLLQTRCDYVSYTRTHFGELAPALAALAETKGYRLSFDPAKVIMVHVRLDDVAARRDYDGAICSGVCRATLAAGRPCYTDPASVTNIQSPLSKAKLGRVIARARAAFPDREAVLLTAPGSDPSYLGKGLRVIQSADENYDLWMLTMCDVSVLSRSTFALASLVFAPDAQKTKTYVPLWGHFVCCGLGTPFDGIDRNTVEYFY